jgi:hypothetical protein
MAAPQPQVVPVFESGDHLRLSSYKGRRYEIIRVDNQGNGIVHLVLNEVK